MASAIRQIAQIAAKFRKLEDAGLGWKVEDAGSKRVDWVHRIQAPDGTRVQLHGTPSDRNWESAVWADLDAAGAQQALAKLAEIEEQRRQERLSEVKRKEQAAMDKAAANAAALAKAAGHEEVAPVDLKWLLGKTRKLETRRVIMTPAAAQAVLDEANLHNRPLSPGRVANLVAAINTPDEWACTHQGGAIDWDGVLQDGQHRLMAIVSAGKPVEMMWTIGADPANFTKIDTGSARSGRDVAAIAGHQVKLAGTLASTATLLINLDLFGPDVHVKARSNKVSLTAKSRAIDEYGDEFVAAVARAHQIRKEFKINTSGLAAAIYLISARLPAGDERVEKFFDDLAYMKNSLGDMEPVRLLRRLFTRGDRTYNQYETLAYTIKAWNARQKGRKLQQLVWRQANEAFPHQIYLPPPPGTAPLFGEDDHEQQDGELVGAAA